MGNIVRSLIGQVWIEGARRRRGLRSTRALSNGTSSPVPAPWPWRFDHLATSYAQMPRRSEDVSLPPISSFSEAIADRVW